MTQATTDLSTYYRVHQTILVDRPELRDASYRPTRPHFTIQQWDTFSRSAALAEFNSICAGEYDFASECVVKVWVDRFVVHAMGESRSCLRAPVRRHEDREAAYYDRSAKATG